MRGEVNGLEMKDAITARRSVRTYTGEPLRESLLDGLADFIGGVRLLHDNIPVDVELCGREEFRKAFVRASLYRAPDYVVLRSALNIDGCLPNVGFIGEQIVLWLTHKGIGSCWAGLPAQRERLSRGQLPSVIAIEFGRADNAPFRRLPEESPRKKLHEVILDEISRPEFLPLLEAGRLAPSAVNLQPVRYLTKEDAVYILRKAPPPGLSALGRLQQIDVGIAMANMSVRCDGGCTFVRDDPPPSLPEGYLYEYTMRLTPSYGV